MCDKYKNNNYQYLWTFHFFVVLVLFACLIKIQCSACKRLMASLFIVFHTFWGIADLLCYSQVLPNVVALFLGVYLSTLTIFNIYDECLDHFRCLCCKKSDESLLDTELTLNIEEDSQNNELQL